MSRLNFVREPSVVAAEPEDADRFLIRCWNRSSASVMTPTQIAEGSHGPTGGAHVQCAATGGRCRICRVIRTSFVQECDMG